MLDLGPMPVETRDRHHSAIVYRRGYHVVVAIPYGFAADRDSS